MVHMKIKHPWLIYYQKLGHLPLYWLQLKTNRAGGYCIMLARASEVKKLLGQQTPNWGEDGLGRVIYRGSGRAPSDMAIDVIKARYEIDLTQLLSQPMRFS